MKMNISTFVAGTAVIFSLGACKDSVLDNPPGKYESSTSRTNSNGTDVSRDSTAQVGYDSNGNKEAVVKTKTTTDPKGLFNKETTTQTQKVKEGY